MRHRWKDYFDKLYNEVNDTDDQVASSFYNNGNPDEEPDITMDEVRAAIHRLKKNKAPGIDNITVEELVEATKGMGIQAIHKFTKRKTNWNALTTEVSAYSAKAARSSHLLFCK